jgi:hypothetical protein
MDMPVAGLGCGSPADANLLACAQRLQGNRTIGVGVIVSPIVI